MASNKATAADTSAKKSKKPILKGKNHHRDIPKAFRGSGVQNHAILCSEKTMIKDVKNYMKTAAYKKSSGRVLKDGESE